MIKKLLATTSTSILIALGGCASSGTDLDLPPIDSVKAMPKAINATGNEYATTLPLIDELSALQKREEKPSSGVKHPNKSEMRGVVWSPNFDPFSEYVVPVKTTNSTGTSTVQQTLITADLPIGEGSCSHKGFEAVPFGSGVAMAPFPGAPVGTEAACSVMVGGQIGKLRLKATASRGISELHFKVNRKKGATSFPQGVCSDAHYKLSKLVKGGPLGACVIVDATGANSATYFTISGTDEIPIVKIGDGENARLARFTVTRLPTGKRLVRVEGPQDQLVLFWPNGDIAVLTRGN